MSSQEETRKQKSVYIASFVSLPYLLLGLVVGLASRYYLRHDVPRDPRPPLGRLFRRCWLLLRHCCRRGHRAYRLPGLQNGRHPLWCLWQWKTRLRKLSVPNVGRRRDIWLDEQKQLLARVLHTGPSQERMQRRVARIALRRSWHSECLCAFVATPLLPQMAIGPAGLVFFHQVGAVCGMCSMFLLRRRCRLIRARGTAETGSGARLTQAVGANVRCCLRVRATCSLRHGRRRYRDRSLWQVVIDPNRRAPGTGSRFAVRRWFLFGLLWRWQPKSYGLLPLQAHVGLLKRPAQLHLLHLSQHAIQIPRLIHRILHMQPLEIPALQLLHKLLAGVKPVETMTDRHHLMPPGKFLTVELKETKDHLPKTEGASPGAAGCRDLLLCIRAILLENGHRQHGKLDLRMNLHEVDSHQCQSIGGQVGLGCSTHFVGLRPELHCNHEIPNPLVQARIGLE
mmetsp:Transcript_13250/g.31389  ORF Transcript_13250/g.31389 Transcript_13250/m.31389 type:complete len:453 (-) Transcript_13250:616-1974(-)